MRITWLGHAAFRLKFGSSVVLIDPFLTGNPSFHGDPATAAAGATHVIVTHGHADHVGDAVAICQHGAKLVANFELANMLTSLGTGQASSPDAEHDGFDSVGLNTGGAVDCGEFSVRLTPALHSSGMQVGEGPELEMGLPNGVVITPKSDGEPVVYHMGDTDVFSDMALIGELWQPDVVMVPIGDRFTMGAKAAALAMTRFLPKARVVLPCHWGTFPVLDASPDAFIAEMGAQAARVKVPRVGEGFTV